jgi:hypothetical protein
MNINPRHPVYALIAVSLSLASCGSGSESTTDSTVPLVTTTVVSEPTDTDGVTPITPNGLTATLSTIPASASVSSADAAGLKWMREEEKLAHDVYITLGDLWGSNVFANISQAENTHVSAVGTLLARYDINDPMTTTEVGVFTDPTFTKLYNDLVDTGSQSLIDALTVGALIEDLDIMDLQRLASTSPDIAIVYDALELGSRNHMRAFYRQLQRLGADYTPVYITQSEFDVIIAGNMEQGPM